MPQPILPELAEGELIEPSDMTHRLFEQLHDLGVMIAIEDFGTRHSSLSYLHKFNLDDLKIDQSFVAMIGAAALSRHILDSIIELSVKLEPGIALQVWKRPSNVVTWLHAAWISCKVICLANPCRQ